MNNYCIHLKKRKNKPYCKIRNNQIPFSECKECKEKEYKSNSNQIKNDCNSKSKTQYKISKMKSKSNKIAKLERNRFSVFSNNKEECIVCKSTYQLTWHEIYSGSNRQNSMRNGFCLRLCLSCHMKYQEDAKFNDHWHKQGQLYWENNIGTREEFIKKFRRNWL